MKKTSKSNRIKRAAGDQNKKSVLKLGLYLKAGKGLQPEALDSADLKNGWYVYSYKKPEKKAADKAANYLYLKKAPLSGLRVYLSSHYFRGVGPKLVEKICDTFGMEIISILKSSNAGAILHSTLNPKIINSLEDGWKKSKEFALGYIFLSELGLNTAQRRFITEQFGSTVITRLNKFPFETLLKIPRLGFSDMENILKRINIIVPEEQFILAASSFRLLQSEKSYGNTCAPVSSLISGVSKLIDTTTEKVQDTLEKNEKRFDWFDIGKSKYIQSRSSKERDLNIRNELQRIKDEFRRVGSNKNFVRSELKTWDNLELSDEQLSAVNTSVNEAVSVITGGPGAGKTTMVIGLVSALEALEQTVKICAPTGRAAKRIQENPFLEKFDPSTIHMFLAKMSTAAKTDFDVMIVDEASMIDIDLLTQLLEKIPDGASLVFIGDPDQLPPVGPGQVFRDIIGSEFVAVSRLTGNFRQAEFSDIIKAARGVIEGEILEYAGAIEESDFVFIEVKPDEVTQQVMSSYFEDLPNKLDDVDQSDFQILSPMRKHSAGIENLNKIIQTKFCKGKKPLFEKITRTVEKRFFTGDRVIMTENNYDKGIMNGDVGIITGKQGDNYLVDFDDVELDFSEVELLSLELAYAISIHKSQGSEYPGVIIPITSEHSFMLSRNLIYTAITRGKQQVILIGQKASLKQAIARVMKDRRYTGLKQILKN